MSAVTTAPTYPVSPFDSDAHSKLTDALNSKVKSYALYTLSVNQHGYVSLSTCVRVRQGGMFSRNKMDINHSTGSSIDTLSPGQFASTYSVGRIQSVPHLLVDEIRGEVMASESGIYDVAAKALGLEGAARIAVTSGQIEEQILQSVQSLLDG